jgi:pimeloyl-ACP methyl ester carboxylesterase
MRPATLLFTILLSMLVLELALLGWLWSALIESFGAWVSLLIVITVAVGWRLLFITLNFVVSGALSKRTGATLKARMGAWLGEALTQSRLYPWQQLFGWERHQQPAPPGQVTNGQLRIVLIHGFLCNAALWHRLRRSLRNAGFDCVHAINLDPLYRDLSVELKRLSKKLAAMEREHGAKPTVLIGHSMGGVMVRKALASGLEGVLGGIAIAAPHHGTEGARLIGFGRERGPPSPRTRWLKQECAAMPPIPGLHNFWTANDNIVWPQDSARLAAAERDLKFFGFGHLHLLECPALEQQILAQLRFWKAQS